MYIDAEKKDFCKVVLRLESSVDYLLGILDMISDGNFTDAGTRYKRYERGLVKTLRPADANVITIQIPFGK